MKQAGHAARMERQTGHNTKF